MDTNKPLLSYTLAVLSGICFVSGIILLSSEGSTSTCTDSRKSYQY